MPRKPCPSSDSASSATLADLARRYGIAEDYYDIWGNQHCTTDATRKRLLAAMLLPVDQALTQIANQEINRCWQRRLEPVQIITTGDAINIRLMLPETELGRRHQWTLSPEEGESHGGEFLPTDLAQLEERTVDGQRYVMFDFALPPQRNIGYYQLEIVLTGREPAIQERAQMTLIVAPQKCFQPAAVQQGNRIWGPTVQLYGIRSRRNWGIGDTSDLKALVNLTADAGGDIVGVNPLHAMFPDNPEQVSPYSPSNRSFINILYIDVEAIPEFAESADAKAHVVSDAFQSRLRSLRASELVAYPEVNAIKLEALQLVYTHFRDHHLRQHSHRAQSFQRFRDKQGLLLENHARFEALQAHFRRKDVNCWGWPAWPEEYRHPDALAVTRFADEHSDAVSFYAWLQWIVDEQLAAAGRQSWRRNLGVGLYQDLALGVQPGSAETWTWQDVLAPGAYAGAPPDDFNLLGQDWGLQPFIPHRLREAAYAPFIAMLRANMRHAGALRIDHVMGIARVFWVPAGAPAAEGAYVAYPLEEMLGILALESQRHQCLIIGEDLGTVPEGFRPRLAEAAVLSYRPFYFERYEDGNFKAPADYPANALATISTHDLPTLQGYWQGYDLDMRTRMGLFPSEEMRDRLIVERSQDRARILVALEKAGLLPEGATLHPISLTEVTPEFATALHVYLARTPAAIQMVQAEDILGLIEQCNFPGSMQKDHPNWCRRLPLNLEDWTLDARFIAISTAMRQERGHQAATAESLREPLAAIIPRATYRLQLNRDFTFRHAEAIIPYLAELGISHCYTSPYLKARAGSMHGYDIVDHNAINPEIGTAEDYASFVNTLKQHGLALILDIVPNHMGIMGADNEWWLDVLENGPASIRASYFDIDWAPLNPDLSGKVLLPLLGDHYGSVLNRGELRLEYQSERGEFSLYYYQHRLPVDPASYPFIIAHRLPRLAAQLGGEHKHYIELLSLITALGHLPARTDTRPARMAERQRDKEVLKRQLVALIGLCPEIGGHIRDNVDDLNGVPGKASSFDALHELIQGQGYRLAYWRVASDEINYRRFFDINDLAAIRTEEAEVFEATHRFVLEQIAEGNIQGLRIDHPDGLFDPGQYFHRLQEAVGGRPPAGENPLPLFLVIEKILADHERLPDDWPIHGATGYRFANLVNSLFVDNRGERRMQRVYTEFTGISERFEEIAHTTKTLIMQTALASELNVLATRLARIAAASRDTCDYTLNGLREALAEVVACFPVYRTYVARGQLSPDDRRHIEWAVAVAKKRSPAADTIIFDFLQSVLTTDIAAGRSVSFRERVHGFAMKFQQFSSPVMAKGVEDTSFYRYNLLTSLNDVGGEPRRFGVSVSAYHAATRERAQRWPHNLLATSTHDSKRAEDVRARLNILSEIPSAWKIVLKRWSRFNRGRKRQIDEQEAPSRNDEYLLYQALIGTWPTPAPQGEALTEYQQRIEAYMTKAVREAKVHSSWVNVNSEYENALCTFIQALLSPAESNLFLSDLPSVVEPIAHHGYINSLSQTLLKLSSPGVPDIYQGCEYWQFNLVDPDNRRAIDYAARRSSLNKSPAANEDEMSLLQDLLVNLHDGRIKQWLIQRVLALRARLPGLFAQGEYVPLAVSGTHANHVCAFARRHGIHTLVVIVPRLSYSLLQGKNDLPVGDIWADTQVEMPADWESARCHMPLLGREQKLMSHAGNCQLADILNHVPLGLLLLEDQD